MLKSRIEGIQEKLSDLEVKKQEAEKKLAEYDERLSLLEKEAEKIVAEYVRQGNEAIVSPTSHAYFDQDPGALPLEHVHTMLRSRLCRRCDRHSDHTRSVQVELQVVKEQEDVA